MFDRIVNASKALIDHATQQTRLRVCWREFQRRVNVHICIYKPTEIHVCAAARKPSWKTASRLLDEFVRDAQRASGVTTAQQAFNCSRW
jgi:hypothetical protein